MYETYLMEFKDESRFLQVKCKSCLPKREYGKSEHFVCELFRKMNDDLYEQNFMNIQNYIQSYQKYPQIIQTSNRFFDMLSGMLMSHLGQKLTRKIPFQENTT